MQPLTTGKYPKTMRSLLGSRLPNFTEEQSKLLIGSFDFIGLNYYTTNYAAHISHPIHITGNTSYNQDTRVNFTSKNTFVANLNEELTIILLPFILHFLKIESVFDGKKYSAMTAERNGSPIGPRVRSTLLHLLLYLKN